MKMRAIVQSCNRADYLARADSVKFSAYRLTVSQGGAVGLFAFLKISRYGEFYYGKDY